VAGKLYKIGPHQGLTTGEKYHGDTEFGQVVKKGQALLVGEFFLLGMRNGTGIAMDALQVAGPGDIPYHYRFLVLGKLEEVRRQVLGASSIPEGIRGFNGAAIQFGYAYHKSSIIRAGAS